MPQPLSPTNRLPVESRRRSLQWGYVSAGFWAVGNGLTTGGLISFLARATGAEGLDLSLLLALPAVVGVLRLLAPPIIRSLGGVKRTCLTCNALSYVVLLLLPVVAWPGELSRGGRLTLLIGLLCANNVLEYIGTVAFWTWFGALTPRRLRGRYFSRRNMIQLAALIPTLLSTGAFADWWRREFSAAGFSTLLLGYALPTGLGVMFLALSLIPLAKVADATTLLAAPSAPRREVVAPFVDRRYQLFLLFGVVFALSNGLTQSAQNIYPKKVLGFGLFEIALMTTAMRIGQVFVSWWAGPFSDRRGHRTLLLLCQAPIALGPVFFLLATPDARWWFLGAWLVWTAYAGTNIGLPNLMLDLAPASARASYTAAYQAVGGLVYAASTVLGGVLLDRWGDFVSWAAINLSRDGYAGLFWLGLITRVAAFALLFLVSTPRHQHGPTDAARPGR